MKETLVPEFPFTLVIPEAVIAEVASGLTVFQVRFVVQLLLPEAIVQDEGEAERVPDITGCAPTLTVTESEAFPPAPVQLMVYVLFEVKLPVD